MSASIEPATGTPNWDAWMSQPPSQNWHALPFSTTPPSYCWVWLKPTMAPHGLILRIPDEVGDDIRQRLTVRTLLLAAGIDPAWVWICSVYGIPFEGQGGTAPMLDQPLARPMPGADPHIILQLAPQPLMPPSSPAAVPATPVLSGTAAGGQADQLFDAIERDWAGCLQAEKDLAMARKQLDATASRLNSLNRDLTPEEFRNSDRQDRDDWQDARRMLRDGASRVTRFIKEQDVGDTTYTGKRRWFEQMLEQVVTPRRPCDGLAQIAREFEGHRKLLQQLVLNMSSAASNASQMGERKAQSVLARIAAKGRAAHSKR